MMKFLKKLNNFLSIKIRKKSINILKQKKYLESFNEPNNDIDRSYYQYKCQMKTEERLFFKIIKNIVAFFVIIRYWVMIKKISNEKVESNIESVLMFDGQNSDFLPKSLNYKLEVIGLGNKLLLTEYDRNYLKKIIKKYPFSYLFIFKIMIKIATYSYAIDLYNPKSIISTCEYSFTSSILTSFCESKCIEHINVMHGEKDFNIRDAFCRFSKFYVWDEYYIDLFKKLRAGESEFIIEIPPSMKLDFGKYRIEESQICDYKFYLQLETEKTLQNLKVVIDILERNENKVILRPHPIYTDLKLLSKYFSNSYIENNKIVNIELSIGSSKNIVSKCSTVLNQAFNNGINIIIDDISNPEEFNHLKDIEYIMLSKQHKLLSEIIER